MTEKLMTKTKTRTVTKINIPEPTNFKVIYINDNVTTMEFVVETLKIFFNYEEADAAKITVKVHEDGSAVVATLPYEIAEQKGVEVTMLARANNFPLQVKIEEDK